MEIAIAGGHGQIARRLTRILVARGDRVRGLIRNPDHAEDLRADGAEPVVCDLEHAAAPEVAGAIAGADAVVFAAGAGPGSGAERKATMDRDGAVLLLEAARAANVAQYVMVSAIGAADPPAGDDVFGVYLRAKADADRAVIASDRDWSVLRPGALTNEPGDGRVTIQQTPLYGEVSRDNVAAAVAAVLQRPDTHRAVLYLIDGDSEISAALDAAAAEQPRGR